MARSPNSPIRLPRELLNPWLLLLVRLAPTHGYDLHERLRVLGFRVATSSVYRGLRQLEADGLVRSEWRSSTEGAAQRVYSLTPKGRRSLKQSVRTFADARDSFGLFVRQYEKATVNSSRGRKGG